VRRLRILLSLLLLAAMPAAAAPGPGAPDPGKAVDLALVLAVDVSESVDADEYHLQQEGIARAFDDPRLLDAIGALPHGAVAVLVLEWSDRDKQVVTVDWTRVDGGEAAAEFAAAVRRTARSSAGLTALGDALAAAHAALDRLPFPAARRAVDVSGDGMANVGTPPRRERDALVASGATINGLAILTDEPWLDSYYSDYVIGGPGAFLMQVEDFQSFGHAMLQKLLAEIVALPDPRARQRAAR
jgi:Protein of unknown function (DUF1194)